MRSLAPRRTASVIALLLLTLLCVWLHLSLSVRFQPASQISGAALFILSVALTLFNARKKLPFLPLMKASTWMQFHIYAGLFSVVLFVLHCGFKIPQGGLERLVAALFIGVAGSGLFGLFLTRSLPPRMTLHGENVTFERIPSLRRQLLSEVENLVVRAELETSSSTIADFYASHLRRFFLKQQDFLGHLFGFAGTLSKLKERMAALDRYLNDSERKIMNEIADAAQRKENLDFQRSLQGALKLWLFVHIPLTYSMLLFAGLHGWLAWKFT